MLLCSLSELRSDVEAVTARRRMAAYQIITEGSARPGLSGTRTLAHMMGTRVQLLMPELRLPPSP